MYVCIYVMPSHTSQPQQAPHLDFFHEYSVNIS